MARWHDSKMMTRTRITTTVKMVVMNDKTDSDVVGEDYSSWLFEMFALCVVVRHKDDDEDDNDDEESNDFGRNSVVIKGTYSTK